MSADKPSARHSHALEPELITDPIKKAELEASNGLQQYDLAVNFVEQSIERGAFRLRPSLILSLHREALNGLSVYAGNYRPAGVEIRGSNHQPVGAHLVPELIENMCDYVNEHWSEDRIAFHLAAYVMWRLNCIHPFADGNGRTSRVLSFVVFSARINQILPGSPTLPELIVSHRDAYVDALDAADASYLNNSTIDVSKMEELISALVGKQLASFIDQNGAKFPNS